MTTNNSQATSEKEVDALQNSPPVRENSPRINQLPNDTTDLLTPDQQRERILTLFVIALISLLTGKQICVRVSLFQSKLISIRN